MRLTFGKMEGSLGDGRSSAVLLDGEYIGTISPDCEDANFRSTSYARAYRVTSYTVDLDEEYGISSQQYFSTLKEARDAVREAVARRHARR